MKKLLSTLAAITLTSSTVVPVVACGSKNENTITYGYVNNNKDINYGPLFDKAVKKFKELYPQFEKYNFKGQAYDDANKLPEQILNVGNDKTVPDTYFVTTDWAAKLANANYILALEGTDSPEGANQILTDLNYNVEKATKVLDDLDAGKIDSSKAEGSELLWSTFLPYAIETSKIINQNNSATDHAARVYGITKHLGVGGGSAVINKDKIGWFDELGLSDGLDEKGNINWIKDTTKTIDEIVKWEGTKGKDGTEANEKIISLFDRGMWWMYPTYGNIIGEVNDKIFRAADIGVNWVNDKSLPYYEENDGKYSSVWTNHYFINSTKEILGKWFHLFAQQTKTAFNVLKDEDQKNQQNQVVNLLDPSLNNGVQNRLLELKKSAGVNYEPGAYADMIQGFGEFQKMDYLPMQKVTFFDNKIESEKANATKYGDNGLNAFVTPAGSGMQVFNVNTTRNPEKLQATEKFVELLFGTYTDKDNKIMQLKGNDQGGIYNLGDMWTEVGDIPAKLALKDDNLSDISKYSEKLESKVQKRVKTAIDKDTTNNYKKTWDDNKDNFQEKEKKAILSLENYSITLAGELYGVKKPKVSLAPNRSAYDEATNNDVHGNQMKANLLKAFAKDGKMGPTEWKAFTDIFGDETKDLPIDSGEFKAKLNEFVNGLIKDLATLNKEQSNAAG